MMLTRRQLLHSIAVLGAGGNLAGYSSTAEDREMKNVEQAIQRLIDREDINELMARYCRQADLLDADGLAACFTDDCVVAYVPASMGPAAHSKQELLGFLHAYFPNSVSSTDPS